MGTQDHGAVPDPVIVRAGHVLTDDDGCFWACLVKEAALGSGDLIADLTGTVVLTRRALDIIRYVAGCTSASGRRTGLIATGEARDMAETAAAGGGALDIASSAGELAALWRTVQ